MPNKTKHTLLSPEEVERERVLNARLRAFGLSLSSTIGDVLTIHQHPDPAVRAFTDDKKPLEKEKIEKISVVPGNWKAALRLWIAELEREVDSSPKYDTYAAVTRTAYGVPADKRISAFQVYLYEPLATSQPKMAPDRHIELCLAAISRGVELKTFIPALKQELTGTIPVGKKRQPKPIVAAAIALFCKAILETKVDPSNANETKGEYCKRICGQYGLKYTDRVRQAFTYPGTAKHAKMVSEHILLNLPTDLREKIETYLHGNVKMYA